MFLSFWCTCVERWISTGGKMLINWFICGSCGFEWLLFRGFEWYSTKNLLLVMIWFWKGALLACWLAVSLPGYPYDIRFLYVSGDLMMCWWVDFQGDVDIWKRNYKKIIAESICFFVAYSHLFFSILFFSSINLRECRMRNRWYLGYYLLLLL